MLASQAATQISIAACPEELSYKFRAISGKQGVVAVSEQRNVRCLIQVNPFDASSIRLSHQQSVLRRSVVGLLIDILIQLTAASSTPRPPGRLHYHNHHHHRGHRHRHSRRHHHPRIISVSCFALKRTDVSQYMLALASVVLRKSENQGGCCSGILVFVVSILGSCCSLWQQC